MAAAPTPLDPSPGDKNSATAFDAGVRDVLAFLLDPPHCEVSLGSTMALTSGTAAVITFDSESSDTDNMHSTTTNTSRIVANTPGRYTFNVFTVSNSSAHTGYNVNARVNAAGVSTGGTSLRTWVFGSPGGTATQQIVSFTRFLATNDYVEIFITLTGTTPSVVGGSGIFATGLQAQWRSIS